MPKFPGLSLAMSQRSRNDPAEIAKLRRGGARFSRSLPDRQDFDSGEIRERIAFGIFEITGRQNEFLPIGAGGNRFRGLFVAKGNLEIERIGRQHAEAKTGAGRRFPLRIVDTMRRAAPVVRYVGEPILVQSAFEALYQGRWREGGFDAGGLQISGLGRDQAR